MLIVARTHWWMDKLFVVVDASEFTEKVHIGEVLTDTANNEYQLESVLPAPSTSAKHELLTVMKPLTLAIDPVGALRPKR